MNLRALLTRSLWLAPLGLSLIFVLGVLAWVRANEADEQEQQRQTLISDALSTEAQLRDRIDEEQGHVRQLAAGLAGQPATVATLSAHPEVNAGLRRLWQSVTWLDANNRVLAEVPEDAEAGHSEDGLSLHLTAPAAHGGVVVVRYAPALLLKRGVPWWLARKYDVQLVDVADQVIASSTESALRAAQFPRPSYRVALTGPLRASPLAQQVLTDAALELTLRDPSTNGTRALAWVLVAGFLPLVAVASWLIRRQMRQVERAEVAGRTEAAWRRAMEDSALVALRARDFDGRLLYVNRTFCEMVGLAQEQLVGLLPPMPYWPPEQLSEVAERNRRNLAGHAPRNGYEAHWCHASGRRVDVMVFESPLVDAGGRQIGWMGSIIDITERKRLEDRERRQVETLAHNARLTMLGEIASTLAHELNQPLTAIASYGAGLTNSLAKLGVQDELVLGALQRLGQQAAHAGRIVARIREFLTRREPRQEPCDLNAIIGAAVELLKRDLQQREVQIELQLATGLPEVRADAVLIEQVVINLVRNAADALLARPERRRIRVATHLAGDFVRVDVQDNGPGLGGQRVEQLCAPFYSTKPDGMGLGLAICRSIVEAHHGVLDAEDAPGGGALFSFSLAARQHDPTAELAHEQHL